MSEDLTGRCLGHYRIDGVIGRGGMSVLYRATDMRLGRKVALKVIGDQLAADPEFRERFVDEARYTSAIDHAHVVPLYDFDEVDGRLYIAMRFVESSDAPHAHGLVHLDIKPANVLVTHQDSAGGEHVYLADGGDSSARRRTLPRAPARRTGGRAHRPVLDSLCCVLFACLTGRPPFPGRIPEVVAGHLNADPPAVTPWCCCPPAPLPGRPRLARALARALAPMKVGTPTLRWAEAGTPRLRIAPPARPGMPPPAVKVGTPSLR